MSACHRCHQDNAPDAKFCAHCGAMLDVREEHAHDPLIGRVLMDRYRICSVLGEGGMGKVYLAEQKMGKASRKVAIKTLHADLRSDPQLIARFHRESETVIQLTHPNTIQFYDFGELDEGTLLIVMEYIEGQSLAEHLEQGSLPLERIDPVLAQVCGSLREAHSLGIIHRDLKPENILLTRRGGHDDFVKVLDFGIARKSGSSSRESVKLTQKGMVLGTPPYMSPEQFSGKELDARSDVYSLAVVTYEMIVGRLPFDAHTSWEWATMHLTAPPIPLESFPEGLSLSDGRRRAVLRALEKKPSDRHAGVDEFLEDFQRDSAPRDSRSQMPWTGRGSSFAQAADAASQSAAALAAVTPSAASASAATPKEASSLHPTGHLEIGTARTEVSLHPAAPQHVVSSAPSAKAHVSVPQAAHSPHKPLPDGNGARLSRRSASDLNEHGDLEASELEVLRGGGRRRWLWLGLALLLFGGSGVAWASWSAYLTKRKSAPNEVDSSQNGSEDLAPRSGSDANAGPSRVGIAPPDLHHDDPLLEEATEDAPPPKSNEKARETKRESTRLRRHRKTTQRSEGQERSRPSPSSTSRRNPQPTTIRRSSSKTEPTKAVSKKAEATTARNKGSAKVPAAAPAPPARTQVAADPLRAAKGALRQQNLQSAAINLKAASQVLGARHPQVRAIQRVLGSQASNRVKALLHEGKCSQAQSLYRSLRAAGAERRAAAQFTEWCQRP